jgi:hypothetical protein
MPRTYSIQSIPWVAAVGKCGTACTHVSLLLCCCPVPQVNVAVPGVTNVAVNGGKVDVVAPGTTVAASKAGAVGEACLLALQLRYRFPALTG